MNPFTLPSPIGSDVPFTDLHVWQWALAQPRANVKLDAYLTHCGFILHTHKISAADYDTLQYALDAFLRTAPRMPGTHEFSALMRPADSALHSFWVRGMVGRYMPSADLVQAMADAGWIYDVNPQTTYFEIINGSLFAKYQTILGSRKMADLV